MSWTRPQGCVASRGDCCLTLPRVEGRGPGVVGDLTAALGRTLAERDATVPDLAAAR